MFPHPVQQQQQKNPENFWKCVNQEQMRGYVSVPYIYSCLAVLRMCSITELYPSPKYLSLFIYLFNLNFFVVLGIESRTSHILGMCFVTELHS
jgi:hypothetical protein